MRRPVILFLAAVMAVSGLAAVTPTPPAAAQTPGAGLPTDGLPTATLLGCDPLDASVCLFPFPNDAFTVADDATDSGRRVAFSPLAMPRNVAGVPANPTEWNRNDGFSPGQAILTTVPGLDLHQTWGTADQPHSEVGPNEPGYFDHRDHLADISRYLAPDAPIVILDADTGRRHPFWSELDTHPGSMVDQQSPAPAGAADPTLILRPAENFVEGHRYVVALRDLRDADGAVIPAGPAFAGHRDGTATGARAEQLQGALADLSAHGIDTADLYLAWDFTVASSANLTERMLAIRDHTFGEVLGDPDLADLTVEGDAPAFTVETVEDRTDTYTDSRGREQTQQLRRIDGRVTVPNFMDRPQQPADALGPIGGVEIPLAGDAGEQPLPASRFYVDPLGDDDLPDVNPLSPTVEVPFLCDIPTGEGPSYGVLYGHGLLGTRSQLGDVRTPRRHGFGGCALDFWGMSTPDVPTVAAILLDISQFPSLADRSQQGLLNFLVMGRAMVHPDGLVTDPAFVDDDGTPLLVVDRPDDGVPTQLYYDGNSQGGILGGALIAVSPDATRAVLGVPGMNYSTLLNRSVDWEGAYGEIYYAAYTDPAERQLGFGLLQMLWDRSEGNGYAAHMTTDPLPNTPRHEVLLQPAFSDHQVANVSAEVQVRTMGAPIMEGLPAGRHWEATPYLGGSATYPHRGSALVYWDSGNATPPNGNIPPTHAADPHSQPRKEHAAGWQEARWLLSGELVDVCDGGPYLTDDHPQNAGVPSCTEPDVPALAGVTARPPGADAQGPNGSGHYVRV